MLEFVDISDDELNDLIINEIGGFNFIDHCLDFQKIPPEDRDIIKSVMHLPASAEYIYELVRDHQYSNAYIALVASYLLDQKSNWFCTYCCIIIAYYRLRDNEKVIKHLKSISFLKNGVPPIILDIAEKMEFTDIMDPNEDKIKS